MVFFVIAYCSWNETFYLNYILFCGVFGVFFFSFKSAEKLPKWNIQTPLSVKWLKMMCFHVVQYLIKSGSNQAINETRQGTGWPSCLISVRPALAENLHKDWLSKWEYFCSMRNVGVSSVQLC